MKRVFVYCLIAASVCVVVLLLFRGAGTDLRIPVQANTGDAGAARETSGEVPIHDARLPNSSSFREPFEWEDSNPFEEYGSFDSNKPARKVALEGIVYKGKEHTPVAGASIALWPLNECPGDEVNNEGALRTVSELDGRFFFPAVTVGEFQKLRVEARGCARWSSGIIVEEEGTNLHWKGGFVLKVSANDQASIRIPLRPAGTAKGVVTDPIGNPVPQAEVFAVLPESRDSWFLGWNLAPDRIEAVRRKGERAEAFRTLTDDQGKYSLTGMPTGWHYYLFCAFDAQGHFGAVESVRFPERKLELSQNIQIKTLSSLQVSVLSPDGSPLPGIKVAVERTGNLEKTEDFDLDEIVISFSNHTRRVTDQWGRVEVQSLSAGRYIVSAWPLDYCPEAIGVEIRDNQVSTVTMTTRQGGSSAGKVVRNDDGPLKQAYVSIKTGKIEFPDGSSRSFDWRVKLGQDGSFRRNGIPKGSVFVHAGSMGACEERVEAQAGSTDLRIILKPHPVFHGIIVPPSAGQERYGSVVSFDNQWGAGTVLRVDRSGRFLTRWRNWRRDKKVNLVLRISDWLPVELGPFHPKPGEVIDVGTIRKPPERSLEGVVLNPSGTPFGGVKVVFELVSIRGFKVDGVTGTDGRFFLGRIPLAGGRIRAEADRYPPAEAGVGKEGSGPVNLQFSPAGYIRGRCADGTGAPKAGVKISIYQRIDEEWVDHAGPWGLKTDRDGCFISKPLHAGRYTVQQEYYHPKQGPRGRQEIDLAEGETAFVEIEVP